MRNRLVPKLMILIPGGDPGDKRIVAFGASENSAYRIFKKSCKCGNERLVSYSWCRKMKAGSCRPTDVTKLGLSKKQRRDSQCNGIGLYAGFCLRGRLMSIYRGTHRVRNSAVSPRKFCSISCVAIAVENLTLCRRRKNCDALNNFGVRRKRFEPSTPGFTTVLRLSVCRLFVTLCIVAKRGMLEQK